LLFHAPSSLWPVLVADLADAGAVDYLLGIALARGTACLPLLLAPASRATHLLEVYTPNAASPLVLFAQPLGAPSAAGTPLQLRMYDPGETFQDSPPLASPRSSPPALPDASPELQPRVPTVVTLTERHSRDLDGELVEVLPEALVGRAIAGGKFVVEELIGVGGVGSVYRATHRDLRIPVAVKVLHENFQRDLDFCRRFHSEGLAASRLDHPNLMRVLDFGQEPDGLLYLAMEHLDGRSLASILEVGRPLSQLRIIDLAMQIAAGLAHAHSRGIVHRDIKPDNIVLLVNVDDDERPDELVKVCDFGIAVQQQDGAASTDVVGTPHYMSPEQCRGEKLDGRSDIYSCGVLMYELATGRMPFDAPTVAGVLNRHQFVVATPPSKLVPRLDPRLDAIIMKALAKEPADRHATMRDLRRELGALLAAARPVPLPVAPISSKPAASRPTSMPPPAATAASSTPLHGATPPLHGATPPREPDADPEWLDRSASSYRHHSSGEVASANVNGRVLAGELVARPAAWLSAFAESEQQDSFASLAGRLAFALPVLLEERQVKALFAVRCTLDELAAPGGHSPGWRVGLARRLQLAFGEPAFLAWLAEAALAVDRPPREITELILRLGAPIAYALYSARLKLREQTGVRRRFVLLVHELGVDALPMLRAGLALLEPKRDVSVAAELATDLLRASPRARDDEAAVLTSLYLQGSPPALKSAAADALVAFWGPRATPYLLGLLGSADPAVTVSAIDGLRQLEMVDEHAVMKIAFAARSTTSHDVHRSARAALMDTVGAARVAAERALAQLEAERAPVAAHRASVVA
jgi:serine/threonine-protein kinase